jgi:hypothetical protein
MVVKKTRRADHLPVAGTLDINKLGRFGTHKHDKTVLRLLILSKYRQTE